jgi:ferritin-like metal-binding protein YciE
MATKVKTTKKRAAPTAPMTTATQPGLLDLLIDGIRDIYWAENHLVKALPKMISASASKNLREALEEHLEVTKGQVARLQQVFELLGEKALARKCDAMEGLTLEGEGTVEDTPEGTAARDLGINMSCQKVEHYEMVAYLGLANLATALGHQEVATLLLETLEEEQQSADILSEISEDITSKALAGN